MPLRPARLLQEQRTTSVCFRAKPILSSWSQSFLSRRSHHKLKHIFAKFQLAAQGPFQPCICSDFFCTSHVVLHDLLKAQDFALKPLSTLSPEQALVVTFELSATEGTVVAGSCGDLSGVMQRQMSLHCLQRLCSMLCSPACRQVMESHDHALLDQNSWLESSIVSKETDMHWLAACSAQVYQVLLEELLGIEKPVRGPAMVAGLQGLHWDLQGGALVTLQNWLYLVEISIPFCPATPLRSMFLARAVLSLDVREHLMALKTPTLEYASCRLR